MGNTLQSLEPGPLRNIRPMARNIITKKLIREGVEGKTLYNAPGQCTFVVQSGSIVRKNRSDRHGTPWTPECIPREVWKQAMELHLMMAIPERMELRAWVDQHLLPCVRNQWEFINENVGIREIRECFEKSGIISTPGRRDFVYFRAAKGNLYYFGQDLKCHTIRKAGIPEGKMFRIENIGGSPIMWRQAVADCKEGNTLYECIQNLLETELKQPTRTTYTFMERFVQGVELAYERDPDRFELHTFDRIRAEVRIGAFLDEQGKTKDAIREHRKEIDHIVGEAIRSDMEFKRYGLKLSDLRITDIQYFSDHTLEYTIISKAPVPILEI